MKLTVLTQEKKNGKSKSKMVIFLNFLDVY